MAERLGPTGHGSDVPAQALIISALGCLDAALAGWAAMNGAEPIGELLDLAFSAIRQ
jgi:hypothetical protein